MKPVLNKAKALKSLNDFVDRNCNHINSVKDITKALGVNYNYFRKIVKMKTGVPLKEFLSRSKIEKAKKILIETDKKLLDIAHKVGFKSAEGFIKSFIKLEGKTPTEYRMMYK
jgi:two-component system response regulator YesN